jgi:RNA polymerase subunit RPABC4/transcription elongation factor Spt4
MAPAKQCLYCSSAAASDEHVISEALGCKEIIKDAICRKCNSTFGHSFEAEFTHGLALFLNFFQIPNGEGKIPSVEVSGSFGSEEIKFKVTGDGKVEAHTTLLEDGVDGFVFGKKFRIFQKAQEQEIEGTLRARHPDLTWTQVRECKDLQVVEAKPRFDPKLLYSSEANRTIAKYALNLLTWKFGYNWVSSKAQDLISHIKAEPSSFRVGIAWDPTFREKFPFAPPKHLFVIVCDSANDAVAVFLYLFSLLPYVVIVPTRRGLIDYIWATALAPQDGKFVPLFLSGTPQLLARQGLTPFPMPEFEFSDLLRHAEFGTPSQAGMVARNAIQFMQDYSAASGTPHICYNCKKILNAIMQVCPYCGKPPVPDRADSKPPEGPTSNG